MIIRFVIENLFSYDEQKELNLIPNQRLKTLVEHKYKINGFDILKMSSIYGANGSGKSNLINALRMLQELVKKEKIPLKFKDTGFKLHGTKESKKQVFVIEFMQENKVFYYGIELSGDAIATEELYLSGLGSSPDELIFERKTDEKKRTNLKFSEAFEKDEKSRMLKSILLEEFVKYNKPVLKFLSDRDNQFLKDIKKAYRWFDNTLQIITPDSKPSGLAHRIDIDKEFKKYAEETMYSLNIGITSLALEKKEIQEFFGRKDQSYVEELIQKVEESPMNMIVGRSEKGKEIIIVKEEDRIMVKELKIAHTGQKEQSVLFEIEEESDGTVRLLDFIPAFQSLVSEQKVYVIDEIERSIHPLLIKELVKKFSLDPKTKGQLIFTTHESNLLDQEIFRQDEIWFTEKNEKGSTDLYSLSDFKEHKTIDIRKGYLNGRYGSVPFLANLQDLNWHRYDTHEETL